MKTEEKMKSLTKVDLQRMHQEVQMYKEQLLEIR
jgi:hypothetical protein